jgi:hypothetical protein
MHMLSTEIDQKDKKSTAGGGGGKKSSSGGGSGSGGSGSGSGGSGPVLSTDGHENMRSGLASVMLTLDEMLEGMKSK